VSFNVRITNMGNAIDSYTLEITNLNALKDIGWKVELDKTTVSKLHPSGEAEVTVTASPPQAWSWDIWIDRPVAITVKATSLNAHEGGLVLTQDHPVYIHQKGPNTPLVNLISGVTVISGVLAVVGLLFQRRRRRRRIKAQSAGEPAGL
jgi:hypothetical protein